MDIEVLNLGDLNPEDDIIIIHLPVNQHHSPSRIKQIFNAFRKTKFIQRLKARGFMVLLAPKIKDEKRMVVEAGLDMNKQPVAPKHNSHSTLSAFDKAMQIIE